MRKYKEDTMAKRGGYPGGGMPGNMSNLMKQAQRMQRQMEEQQKEMESREFEATAGGGAVRLVITGAREVKALEISPDAVDPEDVETLQDLIIAAMNEALRMVEDANGEAMGNMAGGLDLGGLRF